MLFSYGQEKVPEKAQTPFDAASLYHNAVAEQSISHSVRHHTVEPTQVSSPPTGNSGSLEFGTRGASAARLKRLLEITRSLTAETEPAALFQMIVNSAVELTQAERGYLLLQGRRQASLSKPMGGLVVAATYRLSADELSKDVFRASRTAIVTAMRERRTVGSVGQRSDHWSGENTRISGVRSVLCEPLVLGNRVLGVLYVDSHRSSQFGSQDLDLMPGLAAQAAICLQNMKLQAEREAAAQRQFAEIAQNRELKAHRETLSAFLAIASHDLKSPLTVMRTGLSLLRRPLPESTHQQVLEGLDTAVERATRLVGLYLDVQKLESGQSLDLRYCWIPIRDMVEREVKLALEQLSPHRQEAFTVQLDIEENARLLGDNDRVCQIVCNLVDNALKYSPDGGKLTVGLVTGEYWDKLTISDTGLGISEEGLSRLFDPFVRLEPHRQIRGTGLGLFSVRRLLEAHGGRIEVESKPGHGTSFVLHFPRSHPDLF